MAGSLVSHLLLLTSVLALTRAQTAVDTGWI
ncbi:hypothetical protein DNTS_033700 [Danionella cerebrum]|uniref:Uncharacterized protein n=1 Tax=Danionella cerebrum TaxID=2873325 RepID=A0A553QJ40_9TELE|nr:hypothetical protein DNTS_033700 [Danionella translucida]